MVVIAGPPGSGKSTAFPVAKMGVAHFNADDKAAELNGGSYINIPSTIRTAVNFELKHFILDHITLGRSFAFETTFRTSATIEHVILAREANFRTFLMYINAGAADECVRRVMGRAQAGGHAAPPYDIRRTYRASLNNLGRAIRVFDKVEVFDNNRFNSEPVLVLKTSHGSVRYLHPTPPAWIFQALMVAYQLSTIKR